MVRKYVEVEINGCTFIDWDEIFIPIYFVIFRYVILVLLI